MKKTYERRLREAIEVEEKARLWGQEYTITPRFVAEKFGNGRRLLAVQPLNTRPNYYVIRVDSRWVDLHEHMDDIIDAICNEYSDIEIEREYLIDDGVEPEDADLAGHEDRLGWPVFSGDSGWSWSEIEWPSGFGSNRRKLARAATEVEAKIQAIRIREGDVIRLGGREVVVERVEPYGWLYGSTSTCFVVAFVRINGTHDLRAPFYHEIELVRPARAAGEA